MSLFRRKSLRANTLTVPIPSAEDFAIGTESTSPGLSSLKKSKRSFFHNRTESAASSHPEKELLPPAPFTPFKENFLNSLQRSPSKKLQKRPLSGSAPSKTAAKSPLTPNYTTEKAPRISSKDYSHAYHNLYIVGDGQDDEMFTLFEMIQGNRPMVFDGPPTPALSSSSSPSTPDITIEKQPYQMHSAKRSFGSSKGHSRNSSSSSSLMSTNTFQTEFSDFQFDFGFNSADKPVVPRANAQEILQSRKQAANMTIITEQPLESTEYEDFVHGLTADEESDWDSDDGFGCDDEEFETFEECQAVEVSMKRLPTPTMIQIRTSCEF